MTDLPLLELKSVTKRFPGVVALHEASLTLHRGEVHALVGENGAGKSTLIKLLCGAYPPDEGEIRILGVRTTLADPVDARKRGITVVHQEPDIFDELSVSESLALANGLPSRLGFVNWAEVYRTASEAIRATGEPLRLSTRAGLLTVAQRQRLAIASTLLKSPPIVLLDEPTSALSRGDSEWLFDQVMRLKASGSGILYISHRSEEIERLADRVTVLRDGRVVATEATQDLTRDRMIQLMVGREIGVSTRRNRPLQDHQATQVALDVRSATDVNNRFREITLSLRRGEILGLYGLIGAGRSEFAQALFGLGRLASGRIEVLGKAIAPRSPIEAVNAGVAYLPEDRLRQGIFGGLSVRTNLVLSSLRRWSLGPLPLRSREIEITTSLMKSIGVKARSSEQPIEQLSGGNQQKVVFGRWLLTEPKVLILDEPTRGVDLHAKSEIHRLVRDLAEQGTAVLLISSDLPEVLSESDRIAVFRQGKLAATFDASATSAEEVAAASLPSGPLTDRAAITPYNTKRVRELGLAVAAVTLFTILSGTTQGRFLTSENLLGILSSASVLTILALGEAVILISGGIDISFGSLMALSAAACALAMGSWPLGNLAVAGGILVGPAVGLCGGMLNAAIARLGRIHPVVVTLGTMTVYRGLLMLVTGGEVLGDLPDGFRLLANGHVSGIPGSILLLLIAMLIMACFLTATVWGRQIYAYGSNPKAAQQAGISSIRVSLVAFGLGGLFAGLAGMLELAQNGSMQTVMGQGYELKAIAAAVIGGVAVTGGRGSVAGVVLGGVFLSLLQNSLVLWSVSRYHYDLVMGGILILAILADRAQMRRLR